MKTNIAQPIPTKLSEDPPVSQPHDFNMEAVVANNFGQGDDHRPSDPMGDPRFVADVRSALSDRQQAAL